MGNKNKLPEQDFFRVNKVYLITIGVIILFLYGKTIRYEYVGLDDKLLIVDNYKFIHNLNNIKNAFINDVFYNPDVPGGAKAYYRPMLTLSFMFDAQFGNESPKFYHFTNILLHIICCILLYKLFILLKMGGFKSFIATCIFAVHPILSQAISWIPGRNDSLATLFTLASLIYFIHFLETKENSNLWKHLLFFCLAIFTKETTVFLPIMCILYKRQLFEDKSSKEVKNSFNKFLIAGYSIIGLCWFLMRNAVVSKSTADLSFQHLSRSFFENLPIYLQVLQKIILPYNLSIMSIAKDTNYLLSILLIASFIFALYVSKQKRWNYVLFGFIWFNVFLLPAFVVPILTGFEHRVYLPLVGFLIILFEIDYFKKIDFNKMKTTLAVTGIIIYLIVQNFLHTHAFSNKFFFWEKAAINSPHSSLAKLNYGAALAEKGKTEEAIKVYQQGLNINYKEPMIHNNIGAIYAQNKMYLEAAKEFKEENRVNPTYSDAFYNLGVVNEKLGNESEMLESWNMALTINPNHSLARNALKKHYRKKEKK